jgi:hypothetical protein
VAVAQRPARSVGPGRDDDVPDDHTPGDAMTPASRTTALTTRARSWLRRFDSYTLEFFNAGTPVRPRPERD